MNKEFIEMLKTKGVEFLEGLSEQEMIQINRVYNIEFPKELKAFYTFALPVSKGFYNWRDFNTKNVEFIKEVIDRPINDIFDMADEIYWCDEWGDEPSEEEKVSIIREKLKKAPALIPIYAHRYMPALNLEPTPVISVHDTDIIYYGENLLSYLKIEFGYRKQSDINYADINYVSFWSDLL